MKAIFKIGAVILAVGVFAMCSKKTTTAQTYTCTGISYTYTNDIKSIIDANCATSGCHDASSKQKGYDLSSYSGCKSAASNSAFLGSIEQLSGYTAMPQGQNKLSDAQIQKIYCWVNNGTPQ